MEIVQLKLNVLLICGMYSPQNSSSRIINCWDLITKLIVFLTFCVTVISRCFYQRLTASNENTGDATLWKTCPHPNISETCGSHQFWKEQICAQNSKFSQYKHLFWYIGISLRWAGGLGEDTVLHRPSPQAAGTLAWWEQWVESAAVWGSS